MMRSVDFVELATVRMGHLFNGPLLAVLRRSENRFSRNKRSNSRNGIPRCIFTPLTT